MTEVKDEKNVEILRNKIRRVAEEACANVANLRNKKVQFQLQTLAKSVIEEL